MSDEKRMDTALLAENDENTAAEENALVMKLDKPFTFEGQTYTEVDLSGLEDTTAADLQAVGRFVTKKNPAANPATVEMTLEYAQFMAARVAHLPLEFFERLPAKEAIKLKGIVVGFLYGWGQLTPAVINRACVGLSIQLRTGLDYLLALSVSDLNELADTVTQYAEEVAKHGRQK